MLLKKHSKGLNLTLKKLKSFITFILRQSWKEQVVWFLRLPKNKS